MEDKMKTYFKYYKQKKTPPNVDDVIDFNRASDYKEVAEYSLNEMGTPVFGLNKVANWKAYTIESMPGFVFIVNPFQPGSQLYWVKRCLHDYHMKPSKTNLDIHMTIGAEDNVWNLSQKNTNTCTDDQKLADARDKNSTSSEATSLMSKLRWTTVGHHHDWNTKVYSKNNFSPVPVDLAFLSSYIAGAVGYSGYETEAAIINYYHMDSTLSGHTDHSEEDKEAPLISVSFGQTAIFLVGGLTKEEKPSAMYLRSGDMVILMGPSRLRYHAIPRVISDDRDNVQECLMKNTGLDRETTDTNRTQNNYSQTVSTSSETPSDLSKTQDNVQECLLKNTGLDKETMDSKGTQNNSSQTVLTSSETPSDLPETPICKLCLMGNHSSMQCKGYNWKNCVSEINSNMCESIKGMNREHWLPFVKYMRNSRINMNVRQVFQKHNVDSTGSEPAIAIKRQKMESTQ